MWNYKQSKSTDWSPSFRNEETATTNYRSKKKLIVTRNSNETQTTNLNTTGGISFIGEPSTLNEHQRDNVSKENLSKKRIHEFANSIDVVKQEIEILIFLNT